MSVNTKLQIVARQVAAEAEKTKEEVVAEYRQRWEAEQGALQAEAERLKQVGGQHGGDSFGCWVGGRALATLRGGGRGGGSRLLAKCCSMTALDNGI